MNLLYYTVIIALAGCQSTYKSDFIQNTNQSKDDQRKKTEVFGDSLKIVFEYHGDTVIQNRIDLKGTSDDGFDNSYTVTSIWSTIKPTELECDSRELILSQNNLDFHFCVDKVIQKVEAKINDIDPRRRRWKTLILLKEQLVDFEREEIDSIIINNYYLKFELLNDIQFNLNDNESTYTVEKVRIEQYETPFSGGKNYYMINSQNDTVSQFHVNEWMR